MASLGCYSAFGHSTADSIVTLILHYLSGRFVLQVSDRLLSLDDGRRHDSQANKTLILSTPDSLSVLAYSRLAAVDGLPTDEWLARKLTGVTEAIAFPPGADAGGGTWAATRVGRIALPSITQVARKLCDDLEKAYGRMASREQAAAPTVSIAGYRWRPGRPQHASAFTWCLERRPSDGQYAVGRPIPRHWTVPFYISAMPMPTPFTQPEIREWRAKLEEVSEPNEVETILVTMIRKASEREPNRIGEDAMCVLIHPREGLVRASFRPSEPHLEKFTTLDGFNEVMAVGFTPWLISEYVQQPPQLTFGVLSNMFARIARRTGAELEVPLVIESPTPPAGSRILASARAQPRKPAPQRRMRYR